MVIELTPQNIITAGAVITALGVILGLVFKAYDWYKKQSAQEQEIEGIRRHHDEDMKNIKEEQTVICFGLLACLKGLQEQGCNGPITKGIATLEKHLNLEAHK